MQNRDLTDYSDKRSINNQRSKHHVFNLYKNSD